MVNGTKTVCKRIFLVMTALLVVSFGSIVHFGSKITQYVSAPTAEENAAASASWMETSLRLSATQEAIMIDSLPSSGPRMITEKKSSRIEGLQCLDLVEICGDINNQDEQLPTSNSNSSSSRRIKNPLAASKESKSLALSSPVLKGGYRNQYMRFVALVARALELKADLLLPSIKWHVRGSNFGVPFEILWDVPHWNKQQKKKNSNLLPKLVEYNVSEHYRWNPNTTLYHGLCPTSTKWFLAPHSTNTYELVTTATKPYAYGGAYAGMKGDLWGYYGYHDRWKVPVVQSPFSMVRWSTLEQSILQAMRPSRLVEELVTDLKPPNNNNTTTTSYLALHPRVEPEMLHHGHCEAKKVRNLTQILDMVAHYPDFIAMDRIFVALTLPEMRGHYRRRFRHIEHHQHNVKFLRMITEEGFFTHDGRRLKFFFGGEEALESHHRQVKNCLLPLIASVVNLEIAVQADIFVGTSVSTWSVSVWKMRYLRGKPNYEFLPSGIRRVPAMPPPFNC